MDRLLVADPTSARGPGVDAALDPTGGRARDPAGRQLIVCGRPDDQDVILLIRAYQRVYRPGWSIAFWPGAARSARVVEAQGAVHLTDRKGAEALLDG